MIEIISRPSVADLRSHFPDARADQLKGSDAAQLIETAGRICYDSFGKGRASREYHEHILDVGHGSVEEHAQFSFRLTGISRALTHELVRHRVGVAISQRSTRYVDETDTPVADHPMVEILDLSAECNGMPLSSAMAAAAELNRAVYAEVARQVERELRVLGCEASYAKKQARGAARMFLENGLETEMIWSANVRTLRHVVLTRGALEADAEIRQFACELHGIMLKELPEYFSDIIQIKHLDGTHFTTTIQRKR